MRDSICGGKNHCLHVHFPIKPGLASSPVILFVCLLWKRTFWHIWLRFYRPDALRATQLTVSRHRSLKEFKTLTTVTVFILSWSTTGLLKKKHVELTTVTLPCTSFIFASEKNSDKNYYSFVHSFLRGGVRLLAVFRRAFSLPPALRPRLVVKPSLGQAQCASPLTLGLVLYLSLIHISEPTRPY